MDAKLTVTMDLKEIQDAIIEKARERVGHPVGSSSVKIQITNTSESGRSEVTGAEVSFQYTPSKK